MLLIHQDKVFGVHQPDFKLLVNCKVVGIPVRQIESYLKIVVEKPVDQGQELLGQGQSA